MLVVGVSCELADADNTHDPLLDEAQRRGGGVESRVLAVTVDHIKKCEKTVDILGVGAVHGVTLRPSNENAVQLLEVKHVAVPAVDLPLEFKAGTNHFTNIGGRV